jgi:hypothetical protein
MFIVREFEITIEFRSDQNRFDSRATDLWGFHIHVFMRGRNIHGVYEVGNGNVLTELNEVLILHHSADSTESSSLFYARRRPPREQR